jgi:hypothetical protein
MDSTYKYTLCFLDSATVKRSLYYGSGWLDRRSDQFFHLQCQKKSDVPVQQTKFEVTWSWYVTKFQATFILFYPSSRLFIYHIKLTPWGWVLLEKPPVAQLLENFPTFYGTRRFITVFTRTLHWDLFWARSIQSIPSHLNFSKINFNIIFPHPTS